MIAHRRAYVIRSTDGDRAGVAACTEEARSALERLGGRLCLSGIVTVLEGGGPRFATIIEFPDAVTAATWYDSSNVTPLDGLGASRPGASVWLVEEEP